MPVCGLFVINETMVQLQLSKTENKGLYFSGFRKRELNPTANVLIDTLRFNCVKLQYTCHNAFDTPANSQSQSAQTYINKLTLEE